MKGKKMRKNRWIGVLIALAGAAVVALLVWNIRSDRAAAASEETESLSAEEDEWDWTGAMSTGSEISFTENDGEGEDDVSSSNEADSAEEEQEIMDSVAVGEYNSSFAITGLDAGIAELIDVDSLAAAIQEQLFVDGFTDFSGAEVLDADMDDNSITVNMLVTANKTVFLSMTTYFDGEWYMQIWSIE